MSKEKVKVQLAQVCRTVTRPDPAGGLTVAPFLESLKAVRALPLPAKTFYWLNKISVAVEKEFQDYEAARIKVVLTLGEKTDAGYVVGPDNREAFDKEMASLNRELELPIDVETKLELPANGIGQDWYELMAVMDIFQEPA